MRCVTTLVAAILPAVDALRSQTAHMALITLQAMPPSWHPCTKDMVQIAEAQS